MSGGFATRRRFTKKARLDASISPKTHGLSLHAPQRHRSAWNQLRICPISSTQRAMTDLVGTSIGGIPAGSGYRAGRR